MFVNLIQIKKIKFKCKIIKIIINIVNSNNNRCKFKILEINNNILYKIKIFKC